MLHLSTPKCFRDSFEKSILITLFATWSNKYHVKVLLVVVSFTSEDWEGRVSDKYMYMHVCLDISHSEIQYTCPCMIYKQVWSKEQLLPGVPSDGMGDIRFWWNAQHCGASVSKPHLTCRDQSYYIFATLCNMIPTVFEPRTREACLR